ncbi:FAD/NAD(P)-binding protein [Kineosporia sp. J2-2]|uniref:FAD/NAD(P)-binding protein n=1 Tax=Kineosporia corallincola TaxID=2835133 RepID=A0ABS5TLE8_9ACTN|nr:FAD/NAD(P)-binding protein [Kineosporia corallincola]MBT0771668.1 FAD/NAD(P)-binding protein [Kineosporia corallincola]
MAVDRAARPTILIVGGGVAGTLVTVHLARLAARRSTGVDIVVLEPSDLLGRGVAFGTPEDRHLLNVPASGMTALPEEPGHFVAWRAEDDPDRPSLPYDFTSRREFSRYVRELLSESLATAGGQVSLRHVQQQALRVRRSGAGAEVSTARRTYRADAVVVATGLPAAGWDWAPETLRSSPFFVPDPWAPGALDVIRRDRSGPAPVLVVGAGLTMVDVALSLTGEGRDDRALHVVSRSGRLPRTHARSPKLATIPDVSDWDTGIEELRKRVHRHFSEVVRSSGDWRPALDGLRVQVQNLWSRMSDADRLAFLREDAGYWNVLRHRMPLASSDKLNQLRAQGRLHLHSGATVAGAQPLSRGGLRVTMTDGSTHEVGWVVNCTGPRTDIRELGNPLLDDLLKPVHGVAAATVSTGGMGLRTVNGRLIDSAGSPEAPIWTLGALRRGELWETTAVPEIRVQARELATTLLDTLAPLPRRLADGRIVSGHHPIARPRDLLGLPLSTTAESAASFNAGLERVMRLQAGAEDLLREAVEHDPDFALAHAALAMLGHEAGAHADVRASLAEAQRAITVRGDDRERSFVDVIERRVNDVRNSGAQALIAHIAAYPRDALAVSAAVPTIAFSGVTDLQQEAWALVEGLAPAYGDHWWYISLLAFTRQEQSRFEEAALLAESALACEPSSGHAVHAQTHVNYETGQHEEGRVWLDHWVTETGRSAGYRAHFAWHAALHELALGDLDAVRRRYETHLAPPAVTGVRALIDSASLLWRWRLVDDRDLPPAGPVLEAIGEGLLKTPQTPFIALYAAIALTAADDVAGLAQLRQHALGSSEASMHTLVVAACEALTAVVERRWADAAPILEDLYPRLDHIAGSAAQREVFHDTLIHCLRQDGHDVLADELLAARPARRPC